MNAGDLFDASRICPLTSADVKPGSMASSASRGRRRSRASWLPWEHYRAIDGAKVERARERLIFRAGGRAQRIAFKVDGDWLDPSLLERLDAPQVGKPSGLHSH